MSAIHELISDIKRKKAYCNLLFIVANIVVFVLMEFCGDRENLYYVLEWGAGFPQAYEAGEYWRLFTQMFLHGDLEHLINNMLLLYLLGDTLERVVGHVKYFVLYVVAGIGASIVSWQMQIMNHTTYVTLGASGAVFGVLGALLCILAVNKGRVEGLQFKKLLLMAGLSLYAGFSSGGVDNAAHVGGLIIGFIAAFFLKGIQIIILRMGREI
jgi:rhomboid protease GluP